MPNWWMQWAERIALVLAELWTRSRSDDAGGAGPGAAPPDHPANPSPDAPDAPPPPDPPR